MGASGSGNVGVAGASAGAALGMEGNTSPSGSGNLGSTLAGATSIMRGGSSIFGSIFGANTARLSGQYSQQQYNWNAQLANAQAGFANESGEIAATQKGTQVNQAIGRTRAEAAAQGVDVNTGTAATLQEDAAGLGAMDELTIRNNAWRQAFGYEAQSVAQTGQGNWAALTGRNQANSTLLMGGMNAAAFGVQGAADFFGQKTQPISTYGYA